jgi:hypothetical protein
LVLSRSCGVENENFTEQTCMAQETPSYVTTESCEFCRHDGCNGEEMNSNSVE